MAVVIAAMVVAMALLVLYSRRLFEENRTRVTRRPLTIPDSVRPAGELQWRTLVDPASAANRSRASARFADAYARTMSDDTRAA